MIYVAPRHLDLLHKLLHPYDCSFYLFGSRLGTKAKPFSDIDLLYFEELPPPALYALEEALEESDLPYKVDLVYYPDCDEAFKQLIKRDYVCIQTSSRLREVERNHELHFQFFPRLLEYAVRAKPEEVLYIYCSLGSSLFNIVYGKPSFQDRVGEVEARIAETISHFQGQPFAWWVPPSKRDPSFTKALLKAGFVLEADEEAMSYDLSTATCLNQKTDLRIQQVQSQALLREFINLFSIYDPSARSFYEKLSEKHLKQEERLFVGLEAGVAIALASVFYSSNSVGIFNLMTREDKRRRGYAKDMLAYILKDSSKQGYSYATLSASGQTSLRLYEGLGFKSLGAFECFEYPGQLAVRPVAAYETLNYETLNRNTRYSLGD